MSLNPLRSLRPLRLKGLSMTVRRRAREIALQVLYQLDIGHGDPQEALGVYFENFRPSEKAREFCHRLIEGVWQLNTRLRLTVDQGVLAKQVSCYDYQSCEHDTYYASRAYSVMCSLATSLLSAVEGYESAPWGV